MHRWCCNALAKACHQMQRPLPCNTASSTQLTQFRKSSATINDSWQTAVSLAATCTPGTFNSTQVSITGSQLRSQFHRLATQQPVTPDTFRHAAHVCKHHTSAARVPGLLEPIVPRQGLHSCAPCFAQSALPATARQLMAKAAQPGLISHQSRPALNVQRPGTTFTRRFSSKAPSNKVDAVHQVDAASLAKAHKLSVPVGVLAGVFGSFVGVGGGVLIVPLLTGACKALPQRLVSGTSLVAVVSTALASSYTYVSHGVVDATAALVISCCAVLTAPLGADLTATLNATALKKILGYFLVAVAFLVPLKSFLFQNKAASVTSENTPLPSDANAPSETPAGVSLSHLSQSAVSGLKDMSWMTTILLGVTGATAGVASGLLGIGGGTVVTPLLAVLTPLSQAGVLGSSLLAMVPPSCVGLAQHARLGNVDWRMAAGLAAGTAVGSFGGSKVAVDAPAGVLEGIFSVGMLFLGWRTLSGARKAAQTIAVPQKRPNSA
ncbi:TPA: hypothetical protein ACH3X2_006383 [Trebouxia sp. C0005]